MEQFLDMALKHATPYIDKHPWLLFLFLIYALITPCVIWWQRNHLQKELKLWQTKLNEVTRTYEAKLNDAERLHDMKLNETKLKLAEFKSELNTHTVLTELAKLIREHDKNN